MNKKVFFIGLNFMLGVLLFSSCQKDGELARPNNNVESTEKKEIQFNNEGYAVENGHLNFIDENAISNYITKVGELLESNNELLKSSALSSSIPTIPGFASLASRMTANKSRLKSSTGEEGAEEDFLCELNSQLIPDEVIHYVVDTANQVKIAGEIYQITPFGTFIYNATDSLEYNELCETFIDTYNNFSSKIDDVTYTYGNVKFIDSYGKIASLQDNEKLEDVLFTELDGEYLDDNSSSVLKSSTLLKSSSDRIIPTYTNTYGLTSYKAGAKTVVGGWIQSAFGENSWREKRLDSKHRVKVKLYNVNYGFFKNQGFRVEYNVLKDFTIKVWYFKRWRLRSKRITLWSYWSSSKSVSEMVVGIDYFKGYTEFTTFGLGDSFQQNMPKQFSKRAGDFVAHMCYEGLLKTPTQKVRGWATNLYVFTGSVGVGKWEYTDNEILEKAFDAGISAFKSEIKNKTSGFIYSKIGNSTSKPVALMAPDYVNGGNREYMLLSGIHKYSNKSEVHMQLGFSSGGIKLNLNSNGGVSGVGGFTPNKFNVDEAYIFGSVKHNGKWQGIRLYIE